MILSGPEPQRSLLDTIMLDQLKDSGCKSAIIRGIPKPASRQDPIAETNIDCYDHLSPEAFRDIVLQAGVIICRSGYSTIMDLVELNCQAILIPTPGQPEQEYLARYLGDKKYFFCESQVGFNLQKALQSYRENEFNMPVFTKTCLEKYLSDLSELYNENRKNDQKSQQKPQINLPF